MTARALAEAAALAQVSEADAAHAADLAVALTLLKPADRLEFAHPIVREAVYADIGGRERARAHARAAEILAARGASEERIAAQIVAAEPAGDAERVALLRRVAAEALLRGAPAAAAAWLGRALAEPPPPESEGAVLLELSSAELRLGTPGGGGRATRGGGRARPGAGAARDVRAAARRRAHLVRARRPRGRRDRRGDRRARARGPRAGAAA